MRRRLRTWQRGNVHAPRLVVLRQARTTVVIPCYNHARFLPYAVQSLVEQTLDDFDSILVDDCSPDDTGRLLPGLADLLRRKGHVRLVRHESNLGQAASLNEAIYAARTPLVTVLNDDDWLLPQTLEEMVGIHVRHPGVAISGCHSRWFAGDGPPPQTGLESEPGLRWFGPEDVPSLRRPNDLNLTHSGMTLARAAWGAVGGYRSAVTSRVVPYSDRDLQLRVAALYPIVVSDAPLVWWRSDSSVDAGLNS